MSVRILIHLLLKKYAVDIRQVSIAYTATAGLALGIVVVSYILAYLPGVDPFAQPSASALDQPLFLSNPIDDYFLYWRLRKEAKTASKYAVQRRRMQKAFTQVGSQSSLG